MHRILILFLIVFSNPSKGQNIVGHYKREHIRESDKKMVTLEINILNDSTFISNGFDGNKPDEKNKKK